MASHFLRKTSAALVPVLSAACSFATVGPGQVGVVWTPNGTRPDVLPEGNWNIGYFDRTTVYDARSQERDERLEVLASNGLRIVLDASIRYHILPGDAAKLDRELGVRYYEILLGPTLRSQARRVVGRHQPEEIYSSQREVIERQIREGVEHAIDGRHVILEGVLIRNVTLPDTIQVAINDKLQAEQQALKMKFVLAQAQAEAEKRLLEQQAEADRARIAARSHAETDKIEAEGRAEATRIGAAATAEYERLIQQHLTDPMLRWQEIEAFRGLATSPNSKVVFLGRGGGIAPMLELK
jgi:regulator of protease activity HflC (stomatin/prohibitin superfamily)